MRAISATGSDLWDVAIVGGGPVGLFLALELKRYGVGVCVIEPRTAPDERLRARIFNSLSCSLLERRGLLHLIKPASPRAIVHFGGMEIIDYSAIDADHAYGLFARQQILEEVLGREARSAGIPLIEGLVEGVDNTDTPTVHYTTVSGAAKKVSAQFVVGADGGRSTVRKTQKIPFVGSTASLVAYQGIMDLCDRPDDGWYEGDGGRLVVGPGRRIMLIDYGGEPEERISDDATARSVFIEALKRIVGPSSQATNIESLTRFTDNARVAQSYRVGNVFLAGDSAHVQPPFAGQGLNMGLQDAVNLGWKMGYVLSGRASVSLLDSYESERRPVALATVDLAVGQSALMRLDPQTEGLRRLLGALLANPQTNRMLASRMAGIDVHYERSIECESIGTYARDQALDTPRGSTTLSRLQAKSPTSMVAISTGVTFGAGLSTTVNATSRIGWGCGHSVRIVRPDGYILRCSDDLGDVLEALSDEITV